MASKSLPTITLDQYIAFDDEAERRSEYLNGHLVEVEAATRNHSASVANLALEAGLSLKGHRASVSLAGKWLLNATLTDRTDNLAFASLPLNIPLLEIYRNVFWD